MKDEEMARAYRKSLKQRLIDEDNFERLEMFDENVEEAFLAGLKTGRPQWHNLRKDPNDSPKDEFTDEYTKSRLPSVYKRFYLLCLGDDYLVGKYIRGLFHTVEGLYSLSEIIAWCEIPTFDKE